MKKMVRTGLLLIVSGMGASACTSLLGGFDFDGAGGGSGGAATVTATNTAASTAASTATSTVASTATTGEGGSMGTGGAGGCAAASECPDTTGDCKTPTCNTGACGEANVAKGGACTTDGGKVCDAAGACVECNAGAECPMGVCTQNKCVPASCMDGVKNGDESDLDCGGATCPACALGQVCTAASDCLGGICTGNVCSQINACNLSNATNLTGGAGTIVTFANGNFTYAPKCIKVTQGTVVTFNGNFVSHPLLGGTVTSGVGTPASSGPFVPVTNTGTSTPFTMSATGTFPYYCTAHAGSGMTGAVFVVP